MTTTSNLLPALGPLPRDVTNGLRRTIDFPDARTGLAWLLRIYAKSGSRRVLLPGYIGQSMREGSGIFDPVLGSGLSMPSINLMVDFTWISNLWTPGCPMVSRRSSFWFTTSGFLTLRLEISRFSAGIGAHESLRTLPMEC